jgi:hypothetical protein
LRYVEAEHAVVKGEGTVEIGNLEMRVTYVDAGRNCVRS